MTLSLKNYTKTLPVDLIRLAKKNKVRECDETEKGNFVAYVDEGSKSFDVSITVSANGEVAGHSCDCDSVNDICRHEVALLMHIANGTTEKKATKAKKKEDQAAALLDNVEFDALKEWVRELIGKNKDIGLSFMHHFSAREQPTPAEVSKIIGDAVKAVGVSKKSMDLTQLKKLVDLWSETLAPVTDSYLANVTDEKSFQSFHTMLEGWVMFHLKADTNSNKIPKLVEGTLQRSAECINNLYSDEAWDSATGYFVAHVPDGTNKIRMHYLFHLKNIISVSSEERRLKIIDQLARQFGNCSLYNVFNGSQYCKMVFGIIDEYGLFPQYHLLFEPLRFDNDYNHRLIGLLIECNQLKRARDYCYGQIQSNIRDEFNTPYLKYLKEIFTIQKDDKNLAKVLMDLFPMSFELGDYLFITARMGEEEAKKWRTKMLSRASNASRTNRAAMAFCFSLLNYEKKHKKMIGYIDSYTTYSTILQYFEPMALADKNDFLGAVMRKSDDYGWGNSRRNEAENEACFPAMFDLAVKYYTEDYLKAAIRQQEKTAWHFRPNGFVSYARDRLGIK